MSAAARKRILELVRACPVPDDKRTRFTVRGDGVRRGAVPPLEELAGRSRVADLVPDGGPVDLGLSGAEPILWRQRYALRVRYDAAKAGHRETLDARLEADARALIAYIRLPSRWADAMDQLVVGDEPHTTDELRGDGGELLALIAELPLAIEFYE